MELPFAKFQAQYTNMQSGEINKSLALPTHEAKPAYCHPTETTKQSSTIRYTTPQPCISTLHSLDMTSPDVFINTEDSSIGYMFENDELTNTTYCNPTINLFITFHNPFINLITRIMSIEILDTNKQIATLQKFYSEIDSKAMLRRTTSGSCASMSYQKSFFRWMTRE